MAALKYKVISSKNQYKEYCDTLEKLVFSGFKDRNTKDEVALLNVLIGKWDDEHKSFDDLNPIQLIRSLMSDHQMKARDLAALLEISKGYVSDILNYKKGLSKDVVRKLADHFKVSQEAFNRPYRLLVSGSSPLKRSVDLSKKRKMVTA